MPQVHAAPGVRVSPDQQIFSEKEAAVYLGISLSTLRRRRRESRGPDYVRFDDIIQYRRNALDEYLERHTIRSERIQ